MYKLALIISIIISALFILLLFQFGFNVPHWDDFIMLELLLNYNNSHGFFNIINLFFTQVNEHKVLTYWAMCLLAYTNVGSVNFFHISLIGNIFYLVLPFLIYKNFNDKKPYLLVVGSLFLLQPSFYEVIFLAESAISFVALPFLAYMTLLFSLKDGKFSMLLTCVFLTLSIFTNAAGLALIPLIYLNMIMNKTSKLNWIFISVTIAISLFMYFYNYKSVSNHTPPLDSIIKHPIDTISYFILLVGNSLSFNIYVSLILGVITLIPVLYLIYINYYLKDKLTMSMILFIMLSLILISIGRSGFGLTQSYSPRYNVFIGILLALIFYAFSTIIKYKHYAKITLLISFSYFIFSYKHYLPIIKIECYRINNGMCRWLNNFEYNSKYNSKEGLIYYDDSFADSYNKNTLPKSIKSGLYKPNKFDICNYSTSK